MLNNYIVNMHSIYQVNDRLSDVKVNVLTVKLVNTLH